jgi:PAP2 superfamily protein
MRLAASLALAAILAAAAPAPAAADGPRPLRYDLSVDVPIAAGTLVLWGGTELLKHDLAPARCRVCGTNSLDAGARELLLARDVDLPRRASDVLTYAVMPAGVAAHQLLAARAGGSAREGARDLLFVVEAVGIAGSLDQLVKFTVGRQRPFAHYGNVPPDRAPDPDDNLSFYSAHTTVAFSLAAAAGTVSSLRGYRSTPWVWAVGMTLATTVGYLRIAGDEHYLTDVLVGAALGGAIGVAVPLALHGREDGAQAPGATARVQVIPLPLGVLVAF